MARWLENDRPLLVPEDNESTLCLDNKWERNWFASSSACVYLLMYLLIILMIFSAIYSPAGNTGYVLNR